MRVLYLVIPVAAVLGMTLFAFQNNAPVAIRFMEWGVEYPLSLVVAAVYLIGMVRGSTFIGVLRRTVHHATERTDTN